MAPNSLHAGQTVYYSGGWEARQMTITKADIWGGVWAAERTPWGCLGDERRVEPKYLHATAKEASKAIADALAESR